ncbi:1,3-beta-glucan synthase component protein [Toxoplasma gondii MAS]|uniref:1,3-beta-glucan synthase n=2 Tax=Toxoplasma gondii TaxID=5811 RepID=A0A086QIV5_TOXGO|nr:1,3-beta-glucan synthase component protein [Toxoplasma gondii MAS]PUA85159.1 1,3-beta-glucan synthase component protein [Toxoplasma gondii TgCATBr9]
MVNSSPAYGYSSVPARVPERQTKTNIVVIDGHNLYNSKVLDHHPPPRVDRGDEDDDAYTRGSSGGVDDTWAEKNSTCLREILNFLFRSDSRLYAEKYGVTAEDYRRQLRLYESPQALLKRPIGAYVIEQTIWFVVKRQYRFQTDNLYNQLEDVAVQLLNLCLRETPPKSQIVGPDILLLALTEYHNRLFSNYYKWCDYLGEEPFPWQKPPWMSEGYCSGGPNDTPLTDVTVMGCKETPPGGAKTVLFSAALRQEAQQMMYEVALFKLLWGEAANLRHTPELLCWLFHWMCMAWDPEFKAEEEFVDLIRDVLQRIRDEQWYLASTLRSPDHGGRLLYDDINEVFWERAAVSLLRKERAAALNERREAATRSQSWHMDASIAEDRPGTSGGPRLSFTRENLNMFVHKLLNGTKPSEGIKTFMERRTYLQHVPVYLQVLRSFWRVIAWHGVTFSLLFFLKAVVDDESTAELAFTWNRTVVTSVVLHALGPLFDLILLNWRALRKQHFWQFFFQDNVVSLTRIIFFAVVCAVVEIEGMQSPLLHWNGTVGAAYLFFYFAHGLHYYLFVRVKGQMPVFHLLWRLPFVSYIVKPSTFTGNTPLLAEDIGHVARYILFWIPVIALKTSYWLFCALPSLVEATKHIELAIARPYIMGSMTGFIERSPTMLKTVLWTPAFLIWLFDLQIFFLLAGAIYGSLDGCWRRVGFFKSSRKIQKRLLPVLSSAPAFDVASLLKQTLRPGEKEDRAISQRPKLDRRESMRRAFSRVDSVRAEGPITTVDSRAGSPQRSSTKVQYQNCKDPYRNMVPLLRTASLANRAVRGECVDDRAIARKRFGFLWNEVVHSWRLEDIISNAEAEKLCFNELPLLAIRNGDWSLTRLPRREPFIQWNRSTFRLPVYCYCDVVLGFLKKCEIFHHQINDSMARFGSKAHIARQFFREHLSDDPDHQDPRFEDLLHIEACTEIAEALCLYVARYFEHGADLVDAMMDLWNWLKEDGSRLLWINLISLKDLVPVLDRLFTVLQRTGTWGKNADSDLHKCNEKLKQGLSCLVLLPSSDPEKLVTAELPDAVKEYLTNINICFGTPRRETMPSVFPQPVEVEEVNGMVRQFQIIMSHTQQLHLAQEESISHDPYLMPMTAEQMAEYRCLHAILCEADADVFTGEPDENIQRPLLPQTEESDASKLLLAKTEHAVKMYFRRATRILRASNPYFTTTEADRRLKHFANSLLMKMPESPEIHKMISMVTLTPYYREEAALDLQDLEKPTEEGVSKMELLRSLHQTEFEHFLERVDREKEMFTIHQELENRVTDSPRERRQAAADVRFQMLQSGLLQRYDRFCEALQEWASYRGQVLIRTVRGMMYHERAIRMQAYLEQTPYESLHLCHDLNRLDFGQLESIRSPEAELWLEVLQIPPAYELSTTVASTARLKYQYIVAAQEFGNDNKVMPAPAGKELAPAARSSLLRKIWLYKLLVRNPNLRIATIEAEVDRRGVPTGHKLSRLYRLTANPDLLRERVATPATHLQAVGEIRSRYERKMVGVPVRAARMPKPFVPLPHMPFCNEEDSAPSEPFSIKTRAGKKSGDTDSEAGERSGASTNSCHGSFTSGGCAGDSVRNNSYTVVAKPHAREGPPVGAEVAHKTTKVPNWVQEERKRLLNTVGHLDRADCNPAAVDSEWPAYPEECTEDEYYSSDRMSEMREEFGKAEPIHRKEASFQDGAAPGAFDSKLANMIRRIQQRKSQDQEAAQHAQTLLRKMTAKSGLPPQRLPTTTAERNDSDIVGLTPSLHVRSEAKHLAIRGSTVGTTSCNKSSASVRSSLPSCHPLDERFSANHMFGQKPSAWTGTHSFKANLQPSWSTWREATIRDSTKSIYVEDEKQCLTLLERQHSRELARDRDFFARACRPRTSLSPTDDSSEMRGSQNTIRRNIFSELSNAFSSGAASFFMEEVTEETGSLEDGDVQRGLQHINRRGRRNSIITLHSLRAQEIVVQSSERGDTSQSAAMLTCSSGAACSAPPGGERGVSITMNGDNDERTTGHILKFRNDGFHANAPPLTREQQRSGDKTPHEQQAGTHDHAGRQIQQQIVSSETCATRQRRSSYSGGEEGPDVPRTFADRVAMFEELFGKKARRTLSTPESRKAGNEAKGSQSGRRPEMIWLSRRGPMRLEAVYTVRLPLVLDEKGEPWARYPIIGPGKPENQNHAMIFTRMETMQVVDMNMEGYLEETLKLRNLLQEFVAHPRMRILGFREHIFTENVSSLASYMALQENIFTTTNQRFYHEPLQVRMHYGHPDVFDRFFVQTCGSCSKASNGINLSEDVFAGFNCTARGYSVRHVDYIQCGKGRDVGLQQVVMFEKKIAGGNAEQMLSRDVCRMAANMDFFRLLSMYFSGPGFFLNSLVLFLAAYVTLYVKCIFSFSKHKYKGVTESALQYVIAPTTYVQFQLGLLLVVPLVVWLFVEKGCWAALTRSVDIILKLAVAYYNFMVGTKASVIDHVLIYGGAKYQETGRGFVIAHATMKDLWQFYYFTHFSIGLEMMMLLFIYSGYCDFDAGLYFLDVWPLLLMALSLLFVPFLFNPLGMYYPRLLEDFSSWRKWMSSADVRQDKASWLAWWRSEMEGRCGIAWHHQLLLVIRLCRFLVLSIGMVSCVAMSIKASDLDCVIYLFGTAGCLLFLVIFLDDLKLASPNWNTVLSLVLCCTATVLLGWAISTERLTLSALLASTAAFLIFSYGLLEISFALLGRWAVRNDILAEAARTFHYIGGYFLFLIPILLSVFTLSFHKIQTRILFNPNFVTIVKSGLVQRAEVMKKGHGKE